MGEALWLCGAVGQGVTTNLCVLGSEGLFGQWLFDGSVVSWSWLSRPQHQPQTNSLQHLIIWHGWMPFLVKSDQPQKSLWRRYLPKKRPLASYPCMVISGQVTFSVQDTSQ